MLRQFGKLSIVGIQLVLSTMIGFGIGYWLDQKLQTGPWLSLLFLLFGICAGFLNLFREVRSARKHQ
ncbi:MAG: AtpZ/AtpI family protein [Nitrospinota bacterium]|nr:MAG: AtpZ/AtpI family protein [Nitrospinota bacterium]